MCKTDTLLHFEIIGDKKQIRLPLLISTLFLYRGLSGFLVGVGSACVMIYSVQRTVPLSSDIMRNIIKD